MNKPHILFVANEILGWTTYSKQFRSALEARTDVQATILRRKPSKFWKQLGRQHADGGVMRHLRPFDPIRLHAGLLGRDIRRAVAIHRPDVIHFAAHWPAGALAGLPAAPPFTLALDATRPCIGRDLPLAGWSATDCATEASLCQNATFLFPMNSWSGNSLSQDYQIPNDKILVSPPSLDAGHWPNPSDVDGKIAQILFVGNDLKRKGADRLAAWVEGPLLGRCHLHIVSTDRRTPPQGRNITFHGAVPHDHLLSNLMPTMDIFCLPTQLDMSPFVLAEAAAAGLPAVASNIGGIADMIEDGNSGFLVAQSNDAGFVKALSDLIDNADLRQRMGLHARRIASDRFDGGKNFDCLIDRLVEIAVLQKVPK